MTDRFRIWARLRWGSKFRRIRWGRGSNSNHTTQKIIQLMKLSNSIMSSSTTNTKATRCWIIYLRSRRVMIKTKWTASLIKMRVKNLIWRMMILITWATSEQSTSSNCNWITLKSNNATLLWIKLSRQRTPPNKTTSKPSRNCSHSQPKIQSRIQITVGQIRGRRSKTIPTSSTQLITMASMKPKEFFNRSTTTSFWAWTLPDQRLPSRARKILSIRILRC